MCEARALFRDSYIFERGGAGSPRVSASGSGVSPAPQCANHSALAAAFPPTRRLLSPRATLAVRRGEERTTTNARRERRPDQNTVSTRDKTRPTEALSSVSRQSPQEARAQLATKGATEPQFTGRVSTGLYSKGRLLLARDPFVPKNAREYERERGAALAPARIALTCERRGERRPSPATRNRVLSLSFHQAWRSKTSTGTRQRSPRRS